MKYAQISNGIVKLIKELETIPSIGTWVDVTNITPVVVAGNVYDGFTFSEQVAMEVTYTPLEFLRLFTMAERKLMKDSTDDVVVDFLWLADKAQYVSLEDVDTKNAINYFVTLNILTSARATEILGG